MKNCESMKSAAKEWATRIEIQDIQDTIEEVIAENQAELDKLSDATYVSAHNLSEEEFVRMVSEAYFRFKPTMERLK